MSPHYYQAYLQAAAQTPTTNAEGYTLSSTYDPRASAQNAYNNNPPGSSRHVDKNAGRDREKSRPTNHTPSWYQSGNCPCTKQGCAFVGSKKSVEIHMMDRHLIYPPGWDHKKKEQNWDADPSLKGKIIPIHGTSIVLDTPEALDAWIAERKKRFPTTERVIDKKRKLEEAAARGQLPPEDMGLLGHKRRRMEENSREGSGNYRGRGQRGRQPRGRGRGLSRGRGGSTATHIDTPVANLERSAPVPTSSAGPSLVVEALSGSSSDSDSDDEVPEAVSSKAPPADVKPRADETESPQVQTVQPLPKIVKKPIPPQPKKPPHNPFASRPTLLHNLLLPEIRRTVSNLSQAIRFLVNNDFLQDVESKPGEADEKPIQVIGSSDNVELTIPQQSQ
ncbi:hypothetical protein SERLA73DRAFT_168297 [Serpula lacrymans var. lacrymans S7.3]|uniref:FMR1-interacting protein 1 conserved domain-containing protein n=2 Tax=Serpula lacrymans var. lacrymans TaxID=341189 RepID=F8PXR1_SERL3|nr:uncharacterized protein SERLADRAFT_449046 [Serpula lacrymans var. lacrymans S7.9]EGN98674.1 hypothetical protein SERLA73DRAFT_168297 [Serpula lacrymans var. lacrymans S7.3]EGO24278.1 hypothetical protein SERLADRAFT_449046 [Serpula lacrymans var. lacrymans S7.9]